MRERESHKQHGFFTVCARIGYTIILCASDTIINCTELDYSKQNVRPFLAFLHAFVTTCNERCTRCNISYCFFIAIYLGISLNEYTLISFAWHYKFRQSLKRPHTHLNLWLKVDYCCAIELIRFMFVGKTFYRIGVIVLLIRFNGSFEYLESQSPSQSPPSALSPPLWPVLNTLVHAKYISFN